MTDAYPIVKAVTVLPQLAELQSEIDRQDGIHPDGYPATRDGLRLALAAFADELREAELAWREGRCKCPEPRCDHHDWMPLRGELIQAAAVVMRAVRSIDQRELNRIVRRVG